MPHPPALLQSHQHLKACLSPTFCVSAARQSERKLRKSRSIVTIDNAPPTKCQDCKAARLTKPTCAKSSNACLSPATTIVLSWSTAPCSMSCVIISIPSPDGKPSNAKRTRAPSCQDWTPRSGRALKGCCNWATTHNLTGPEIHDATPSPRQELAGNALRITSPAASLRRMTLRMSVLPPPAIRRPFHQPPLHRSGP